MKEDAMKGRVTSILTALQPLIRTELFVSYCQPNHQSTIISLNWNKNYSQLHRCVLKHLYPSCIIIKLILTSKLQHCYFLQQTLFSSYT